MRHVYIKDHLWISRYD